MRYSNSVPVRIGDYSIMPAQSKCYAIYQAVRSGGAPAAVHTVRAGERLDTLAAQFYGDSRLWWVIAAASGIGWPCQVPPGTLLRIPSRSFARSV